MNPWAARDVCWRIATTSGLVERLFLGSLSGGASCPQRSPGRRTSRAEPSTRGSQCAAAPLPTHSMRLRMVLTRTCKREIGLITSDNRRGSEPHHEIQLIDYTSPESAAPAVWVLPRYRATGYMGKRLKTARANCYRKARTRPNRFPMTSWSEPGPPFSYENLDTKPMHMLRVELKR